MCFLSRMSVIFGLVYKAGPRKTKQVFVPVFVNDKTDHIRRYNQRSCVVFKFSQLQYYLARGYLCALKVLDDIVVAHRKSCWCVTIYTIVPQLLMPTLIKIQANSKTKTAAKHTDIWLSMVLGSTIPQTVEPIANGSSLLMSAKIFKILVGILAYPVPVRIYKTRLVVFRIFFQVSFS